MNSSMKSQIRSIPSAWGIQTNFPPDVPVVTKPPSPDVQRMLNHLRERRDAPKIRLPGR
jgi:hypothetical protein